VLDRAEHGGILPSGRKPTTQTNYTVTLFRCPSYWWRYKPNTSKPAPGHKIYPYLLRDLAVTRPNQVWAMDLTYIPMARGFVYLAAVIDWFSRQVLS